MPKQKVIVIVTLAVAVLGALGSFFTSSGDSSAEPTAFHTLFVISLIVMALHAGAAVLITSRLEAFKARLRTAYALYCMGFVALGFTFLQSPLLSLLDLWDSPYVETGIIALPFLAAALLLFSGSRLFARIIGIKNAWSSFWVATAVAIAVAGLMFVVPHPYVGIDELSAEGGAAITALLMIYLAFAAVLTHLIRQKTNAYISRATGWLFFMLVASAVAGLQHTLLGVTILREHWYLAYGVSFLPHIVGGALALKAAYNFSRIESQDVKVDISADDEQGVALKAVWMLAGLASRAQDIDHVLDTVRAITAQKKGPADPLTENEQRQLADVFLMLERYLIEQEPLRQFDKATLRATVRQSYSINADKTFWQSIGEGPGSLTPPPPPPILPTLAV